MVENVTKSDINPVEFLMKVKSQCVFVQMFFFLV